MFRDKLGSTLQEPVLAALTTESKTTGDEEKKKRKFKLIVRYCNEMAAIKYGGGLAPGDNQFGPKLTPSPPGLIPVPQVYLTSESREVLAASIADILLLLQYETIVAITEQRTFSIC